MLPSKQTGVLECQYYLIFQKMKILSLRGRIAAKLLLPLPSCLPQLPNCPP
jgi:hypothetical protein